MLTITDYNDKSIDVLHRKAAIISGRIHPGEANGSWMMHGLISFLLSNQPEAIELRKKVVIKIVPMINPDGVILGNYRTGLAGRDLNREFRNTDKMLFPTVHALKELVRSVKNVYGNRLLIFLDLHGHSVKKNVFAYGPEYPIFDINYFKCRLMPKLLS